MRWIDVEKVLTVVALAGLLVALGQAFTGGTTPAPAGPSPPGIDRHRASPGVPPAGTHDLFASPAAAAGPQAAPSPTPVVIESPSPAVGGPAAAFHGSRFKLMGVLTRDDETMVVLRDTVSQRETVYYVGDFVEGAEILAAGADHVELLAGAQRVTLRIEQVPAAPAKP